MFFSSLFPSQWYYEGLLLPLFLFLLLLNPQEARHIHFRSSNLKRLWDPEKESNNKPKGWMERWKYIQLVPQIYRKFWQRKERGGRGLELGVTCIGGKEVAILATGEFFYRRIYQWQADSHILVPTCDSNGNVNDSSWESLPWLHGNHRVTLPFYLSTQHSLSGSFLLYFIFLPLSILYSHPFPTKM